MNLNPLLQIDVMVTQAINGLAGRNDLLDAIMLAVTNYGVPLLVVTVALQWWTRQDRKGSRHAFVSSGLAFLLGLGVNQIILLFVSRVRPYDAGLIHLLLSPTTDPSFPSDHSTASFAIAASLLAHGMNRRGIVYLSAALLICFSRIFVGTHYLSDVVGGALIGCAAAVAVRYLYRRDTHIDRLVTSIL